MQRMYEKYQEGSFGKCPRVSCQGQGLLPIGQSDQPRNYPINVYCPRCQELYFPRSMRHVTLDGAYFGTTFAHMFLLNYPELIPRGVTLDQKYTPRIYGFRINQESDYFKLR